MSSFKQISVEETKEMISSDIYLLDIRDKSSYSSSHISGAIHVSNESIDQGSMFYDVFDETPIIPIPEVLSDSTETPQKPEENK